MRIQRHTASRLTVIMTSSYLLLYPPRLCPIPFVKPSKLVATTTILWQQVHYTLCEEVPPFVCLKSPILNSSNCMYHWLYCALFTFWGADPNSQNCYSRHSCNNKYALLHWEQKICTFLALLIRNTLYFTWFMMLITKAFAEQFRPTSLHLWAFKMIGKHLLYSVTLSIA